MSSSDAPPADAIAGYRYDIVFLVALAAVVFIIVTPDTTVSRAVAYALVSSALIVVAATSREPSEIRVHRVAGGSAVTILLALGIAVGVIGRNVSFLLTTLVTLWLPFAQARGLLRLVREHGVTLQAVLGALAVYLFIGLAFASAIGFAADVGPPGFFAQTPHTTASMDLYYSFTVMTTTGLGDLTAAHNVGRAMAVIEMLIGQLYLVTVIGIVIGRRVQTS